MSLVGEERTAPRAVRRRLGADWEPAGGGTFLLAIASLALAGTLASSRTLAGDSLYDLYAGRYVVHHGIPRVNVITAAAHGAPWIDQQWLAHVLYYGAWAAGGYPALSVLSAALVAGGFAVLAATMSRRGVPPSRMFAWTTAAFLACTGNTIIRAQSFGFLFLALLLWLLVEDGQAPRLRRRTWLAVPLLVLWANTHGSVLLGAGLAGIYATYRVARSLAARDHAHALASLAFGAASGAAVLCTPYGAAVTRYYESTVANPAIARYVGEWHAPSLTDGASWPFFALVVALTAALAAAWRRGARPDPVVSGLALALLALALTGVRFQAWFAFGGSLLAADTLARASGGRAPEIGGAFRRTVAGVLAAAALASLAVVAATPDSQFLRNCPRAPVDVAAAVAAEHPAMRVLGDEWCSPTMLWLHPEMFGRVAFDSRLEQFSQRQFTAYFDFLTVQGAYWQRVMSGYDLIVVSPRLHPQLAKALVRLRDWRTVLRDRDGLVLERRARA